MLTVWSGAGVTLVFTSSHNITENTALLSVFSLISHTSTSPTASSPITDQWSTSTIQHFLKALLPLQCPPMNDETRDSGEYRPYIANYAPIWNMCRSDWLLLKKMEYFKHSFTSSSSLKSSPESCRSTVNHHMVGGS